MLNKFDVFAPAFMMLSTYCFFKEVLKGKESYNLRWKYRTSGVKTMWLLWWQCQAILSKRSALNFRGRKLARKFSLLLLY